MVFICLLHFVGDGTVAGMSRLIPIVCECVMPPEKSLHGSLENEYCPSILIRLLFSLNDHWAIYSGRQNVLPLVSGTSLISGVVGSPYFSENCLRTVVNDGCSVASKLFAWPIKYTLLLDVYAIVIWNLPDSFGLME